MTRYSTYADEQLLSLLNSNDELAFTEIYNRYWEKLFFTTHKRLQSAEEAKEIVQTLFLTLWRKRNSLEIKSLELYLAAMARHAVYRYWSAEKSRKSHPYAPQMEPDKLDDLENKQLIDILVKFAETLPEHYRIIFVSHKLMDKPLEEVAAHLGVSPRTAERYVSKVMTLMRKRLEKVAFLFSTIWYFIHF